MSYWRSLAREAIERANLTVSPTATFQERQAAIRAAYPFGDRSGWPYKAWLVEQRRYLRAYQPWRPSRLFPDLPRDPLTGRPVIR